MPLSRAAIERIITLAKEYKRRRPWVPLPGPQTLAYESQAIIVGFGGAAGGGKGLALDTPLPTPGGWTTMGDVQVGDRLLGDQGRPCLVTAVSEISHRPCFRLRFDDGSELVADDVHRWLTFDSKELAALTKTDPAWRAARRAKRPGRGKGLKPWLAERNARLAQGGPPPAGTVRDTAELAATLLTPRGRRNHAIATAMRLELDAADLPVAPYVLGAWLGDGSARNSYITGIDGELLDHLRAEGEQVESSEKDPQRHLLRGLKPRLRALGVLENKHVPAAYLRGSSDQRLALLQGLMDTDGHAALDGGCEFDNTNLRLAEAVYELAMSLGLKATLREGRATLRGKDCGPRWRVKFTTELPVFRLSRKAERLKPTRRVGRFRYLVACEPVATVPTRCIAVDSPSHLYLAGRSMIPTHNTDLACGKALTKHRKAMVLRRVSTELTGIEDRLEELIGDKKGYNGQKKIWRTKRHDGKSLQIEFASLPNAGDETGYQGRPHDLLVFDEASNFLEGQVRFLLGWLRTVLVGQPVQALLCFNPPTSAEGRWIIEFFAPWLDPKHPNPALPGELRWAASVNGKDIWVEDERPFVLEDGAPCYEFDPKDYKGEDRSKIIKPLSRTFIPSRVTDNPYLMDTGYMSMLQALPEPLRSQMLNGDFMAGVQDSIWQVIPTAWVEAAMARWPERKAEFRGVIPHMDSMGVDVARGGPKDQTVISRRHGNWYDELKAFPGKSTPTGNETAALVLMERRNYAPIHLDVIGVGASPYDLLRNQNQQVIGVNVAEKSNGTDKSGRLRFQNQRSELWWKMREALDPDNNTGVALPPDKELLADLTAPEWELKGAVICVESREDIIDRIGRSPDKASAVILAQLDTPNAYLLQQAQGRSGGGSEHDPYADL